MNEVEHYNFQISNERGIKNYHDSWRGRSNSNSNSNRKEYNCLLPGTKEYTGQSHVRSQHSYLVPSRMDIFCFLKHSPGNPFFPTSLLSFLLSDYL